MTTADFFRWLHVKHRETYGPGRINSTKKLLQENGFIPKYKNPLAGEHIALILCTLILAPTFRLTREGADFVKCLYAIRKSRERNIFSFLKWCLEDVPTLNKLDAVFIELTSANGYAKFNDGSRQDIFTTDFPDGHFKRGIKSFAFISGEHLKEIYVRLNQEVMKGGQIDQHEYQGILSKAIF